MYAVIFTARINELDEMYASSAARMRELAYGKYGCTGFIGAVEGDQEVTISYWDDLEQIRAWNRDPEHRNVQKLGREKWYSSFQVQVVQVVREYAFGEPEK